MTERYRVVRIEEERVKFVGVVQEDDQGISTSAVSARISQDPRTPVFMGFHRTTPGIGTSELDHCDMLGQGHCYFDGRTLGVEDKFPKTDQGQIKFLTKALRKEERRRRDTEPLEDRTV